VIALLDKKAVEVEAVVEFQDYGPQPFVFDMEAYTLENDLFRQAIWTGTYTAADRYEHWSRGRNRFGNAR